MKLLPAAAMCTLALAAAGCADDDDDDEPGRAPAAAARLEVVVRPAEGEAPVRQVQVACEVSGADASIASCRRLRGLSLADLAPVPEGMACAEIYGGPAVATVRGTLGGEPVDARFNLTDSCEIARWRRNRALLGPVP
jgi:hypothetical protein